MTIEQQYKLEQILSAVRQEMVEAEEKFGPFHSSHEGHSVLREEVEELWEHVRANTGRTEAAKKEAIQVAAMAVRYIFDLTD